MTHKSLISREQYGIRENRDFPMWGIHVSSRNWYFRKDIFSINYSLYVFWSDPFPLNFNRLKSLHVNLIIWLRSSWKQ